MTVIRNIMILDIPDKEQIQTTVLLQKKCSLYSVLYAMWPNRIF